MTQMVSHMTYIWEILVPSVGSYFITASSSSSYFFFIYQKYYRLHATSIRDSLLCVDSISASSLFQYFLLIFRFYIDPRLAVNYIPDNLPQINFSLVVPQFGFIT